ncbi:MAG: DUF445 domain-containing protein [Christensenellaceae bacterium]
MELFWKIIGYISGPILGAAIGYFTNWLAVRMLFRPYYPKRIGKWQLPFTPGIIPRRQPALAKAIGRAVGEELLTGDDLKQALLSADTEKVIVDAVVDAVDQYQWKSIDEIASSFMSEHNVEKVKDAVSDKLSDKIVEAAEGIDFGKLLAQKGPAILKSGKFGVLSMFISDDMIASFAPSFGKQINEYVAQHGKEKLQPAIRSEIATFCTHPVNEEFDLSRISEEKLRQIVARAYRTLVGEKAGEFLKQIDISAIVETKVASMDVKSLEKLCLSVMKKELAAVVNLGAVIGLLIGILNIFL